MTIAVNRNLSNLIFFSGYFRNCLNCDSLRWSHNHFICIPAVHIISSSVSFLSRVDELNELASLQCMGLHSSAGRALQRTGGRWFKPSLCRRVVPSDKKLYSTLSLFTQVCKWVRAIIMLGVTLRWTNIPSIGK